MVALAEELSVLLATSLLEVLVSAIETAVSLRANRINPASRIARVSRTVSLLMPSPPKSILTYNHPQWNTPEGQYNKTIR
jgi:hypothetical protein